MDTVTAVGSIMINHPGRIKATGQLGVDETVFLSAGRRRQFVSSVTDVEARTVLDVFEGRQRADLVAWFRDQPESQGERSGLVHVVGRTGTGSVVDRRHHRRRPGLDGARDQGSRLHVETVARTDPGVAHHLGVQRAHRRPQLDHQENQTHRGRVHQLRALTDPDPARHRWLQLDAHRRITPLNCEGPEFTDVLVVLLIVVVYNRTHVRACEEVDKREV